MERTPSLRTAIAVGAVAALLATLVVVLTTERSAAAQTDGDVPVLDGEQLTTLYDLVSPRLPGVTQLIDPPPITGDPGADARIRTLAIERGYQLRTVASADLVPTDGASLQPAASQAWEDLQAAAAAAGAPISLASGYRSVDAQQSIFVTNLRSAGQRAIGRPYTFAEIASGAADAAIDSVLQFNSIPGYSKHHSGYALDMTALGGSLGGFSQTFAYSWISADNYRQAKTHGFLPSYPPGASEGPDPEPWEFVYVGEERIRCAETYLMIRDPATTFACPIGSLDSVTVDETAITVRGWTADADVVPAANQARIEVDGAAAATVTADRFRPDVDAALGIGAYHGYQATVYAAPGQHEVCVFGENDQADQPDELLGCRAIDVQTALPVGSVDEVSPRGSRGILVRGWAADPDSPGNELGVHVYKDGVFAGAVTAGDPRPDVALATPFGRDHGFSLTIPAEPGPATVCVYALSAQRAEPNPLFACRFVDVPEPAVIGALDGATTDGTTVRVRGWAADPDVAGETVPVDLYVDGGFVTRQLASDSRPDVDAALGLGPDHGYSIEVPAPAGASTACVYGVAVQPGTPNPLLRCASLGG